MKPLILTTLCTVLLYGCNYTSNPIENNNGSSDTEQRQASNSPAEDNGIYFEEHIKPITMVSCMPCHGPGNPKNWQDFKSTQTFSADILASVNHEPGYKAMPIGGKDKLKKEQIKLIKDWIDSGMKEKAPVSKTVEEPIQIEPEVPTQEEPEVPTHEDPETPEVSTGETIYKKNCASCHDSSSMYPRLAGQQKQYLVDQLKDFKKAENGGRVDPIMNYYAQSILVTDEDIEEVSNYLSKLDPCSVKPSTVDIVLTSEDKPADIAAGKIAFASCTSCHTDSSDTFPLLNGQNPNYILKSLEELKSQKRPSNTMKYMLGGISRKQMIDISAYLNTKIECKE